MHFKATGFVSSMKYSLLFATVSNKQTGNNQAEYLYVTAICDVHNDHNHLAAVCVKDA